MTDDIAMRCLKSAPVPEELDWPLGVPGFVLEFDSFPGALEAVAILPVKEAHFRYTAEMFGGGGPYLTNPKFVLVLGPIASTESPFGLLHPFYEETDVPFYRTITGPIMDSEKKRWTLGVKNMEKLFLWYVEGSTVVSQAVWDNHESFPLDGEGELEAVALKRTEILPH